MKYIILNIYCTDTDERDDAFGFCKYKETFDTFDDAKKFVVDNLNKSIWLTDKFSDCTCEEVADNEFLIKGYCYGNYVNTTFQIIQDDEDLDSIVHQYPTFDDYTIGVANSLNVFFNI